ncbi:MAG: tetraacyldisaccharide 4'-kinase [Cypionkella sp.]|nr:tetraacyldisaccharide 4'-kinase [Cypionkella sp.]
MQAPNFWTSRGMAAQILRPLGAIAALATARRVARLGVKMPIPVICVGNINAGGTGKTPTVIALIERLAARTITPTIVTRGYGGRLLGPLLVDPNLHSAADVGDEPLLLSAFAQVIVARDRAAGARMAHDMRAQVIVLDDGHQNPSLVKDLSIVVVDAGYGFGNGLCLPAGPLREPVRAGLARADMVISIGDAAAQADFALCWGQKIAPLPHITGALRPLPMGVDWQGAKVVAFAGIGRPEKFFSSLRAAGAILLHAEALGDHAPLPEALLSRLLAQARAHGADLVTTEKDAVRLPPRYRSEVLTLPVRLHFADATPLDAALDRLGLV